MNLAFQTLLLTLLLSCSLLVAQRPGDENFHQQQQQQLQQQHFQQQQQQHQQNREEFRTPHEALRNDHFVDRFAQPGQPGQPGIPATPQIPTDPIKQQAQANAGVQQQQQQVVPPAVPQPVGQLLRDVSFEAPFIEIEGSGTRVVPNWRSSGTTVVNTNFIRLTPDRQSKKGALWSRRPAGVNSLSSVFKFRISGQGKQFFGDGIGLWFTQDSYYTEGILHGFKEKFRGIAVIFDTFKNLENASSHRDVTVLVNDGEKTWEMMTQTVEGCNINVRYHNDRADFSVEDYSKAKININGNNLELFIDAKNSGQWSECVRLNNLPLEPNWLQSAHIGITATTGQLADNHDVISFNAYTDQTTLTTRETDKDSKRLFESMPQMAVADRLQRLEDAINYVFGKLDYTAHYLEHEFASIDDHIDSVTNKLKSREDSAETRIENIEESIRKRLDDSLNERLTKLEQGVNGNLDRKLNAFESIYDKKTATATATAPTIDKIADCNCSSTPFYASIVFNVLACIWFYYIFHVSKKKHLL